MESAVYDKTTGELLGTVPEATPESTAAAITAAHHAFETTEWRKNSRLREACLSEWAHNIDTHREELVDILVAETGKIRSECEREILFTVDALRFNSQMGRTLAGTAHELPDGSVGHVIREPIGVAAFIVPWNWPLFLLFRDLAPALAAGVTAVVKPAPLTPLATQRAYELAPASLPAHVVNVVNGGADVGEVLSAHPLIAGVAFTGSTAVGRIVAQTAASRFAKVMLELGGKGASLVFADADLGKAADAVIANAFITAGQMCMANTRVLVHRSQFEMFRTDLVSRVEQLVVGDPRDPATAIGAIITETQAKRVESYLDIARAEGSLLTGGDRVSVGTGAFLTPAVISGESIDYRLRSEEIFGPVVTVEPFDTEADAFAAANDTPYGLAAAVWTADNQRVWRAGRELKFGTVWANRYNRTFAEVPSGGMKASGIGRTRGFEGLHEFTELKHINIEMGS